MRLGASADWTGRDAVDLGTGCGSSHHVVSGVADGIRSLGVLADASQPFCRVSILPHLDRTATARCAEGRFRGAVVPGKLRSAGRERCRIFTASFAVAAASSPHLPVEILLESAAPPLPGACDGHCRRSDAEGWQQADRRYSRSSTQRMARRSAARCVCPYPCRLGADSSVGPPRPIVTALLSVTVSVG